MNNAITISPNTMPVGDGCYRCRCIPCVCWQPPAMVYVPYPVFTPAQPLFQAKRTIELSDDEAKTLAEALRMLADKLEGK